MTDQYDSKVASWEDRRADDELDESYRHRAHQCQCDLCYLHGWTNEESGHEWLARRWPEKYGHLKGGGNE